MDDEKVTDPELKFTEKGSHLIRKGKKTYHRMVLE